MLTESRAASILFFIIESSQGIDMQTQIQTHLKYFFASTELDFNWHWI